MTCEYLFSHVLSRCCRLQNPFWLYDAGINTSSYTQILSIPSGICVALLLSRLFIFWNKLVLLLVWFYCPVLFAGSLSSPFHLSIPVSWLISLCIILTLKYGICSIWLFLGVSCHLFCSFTYSGCLAIFYPWTSQARWGDFPLPPCWSVCFVELEDGASSFQAAWTAGMLAHHLLHGPNRSSK